MQHAILALGLIIRNSSKQKDADLGNLIAAGAVLALAMKK